MKTRFLMYLAILSMAFTTLSAKADRPVNEINIKPNSVIEAFIKANLNGNAALFDVVLKDGATIKVNRKDKVIEHSKSEILDFYKKSGEIMLNCSSDFEILTTNDCTILARVDFKFPSFVQQNYISIERDRKGAWKITHVNRFNV
ncbi:hypothetical protein [Pedobacter frigoris]|uniref:hypothetical protein n=1 Tax=Pedobacter frigoris TaxID=2571272 RepID=UPI0029311CED|nr:hypothetical protein [Pedobacter frigoris]